MVLRQTTDAAEVAAGVLSEMEQLDVGDEEALCTVHTTLRPPVDRLRRTEAQPTTMEAVVAIATDSVLRCAIALRQVL